MESQVAKRTLMIVACFAVIAAFAFADSQRCRCLGRPGPSTGGLEGGSGAKTPLATTSLTCDGAVFEVPGIVSNFGAETVPTGNSSKITCGSGILEFRYTCEILVGFVASVGCVHPSGKRDVDKRILLERGSRGSGDCSAADIPKVADGSLNFIPPILIGNSSVVQCNQDFILEVTLDCVIGGFHLIPQCTMV